MKKFIITISLSLILLSCWTESTIEDNTTTSNNQTWDQNICNKGVEFEWACEMECSWVEFDNEKWECWEKTGSCCNVKSPFKDVDECEETCKLN